MIIVAEPLSECVILITTELVSDCRTEEEDQFPRAKIKAFSKLLTIVSIVRAQVERKIRPEKQNVLSFSQINGLCRNEFGIKLQRELETIPLLVTLKQHPPTHYRCKSKPPASARARSWSRKR